ncbi:MAG TPA: hypothetical protein VHG32_14230 [Thermoanaerobaculia bacterium]|nr:hypothetical protein [Thermoanaerobaculia bacterium]
MCLLGRIPKHVTENPRPLLHYVMEKCPLCGQAISKGHRSWQLASAIVGTASAVRLEDLIEERKWRESTAIAEFHVKEDDFQYHALSCDAVNRIAILKVWLPFELYDRDRVIQVIQLDPAETEEVNALARGEWESL